MEYKLEIKLLSPACFASGHGMAGGIDTDVVFDDFGLPFIPAKRIRGVLRENAQDVVFACENASIQLGARIGLDLVDALFGKRGTNSSPLQIHNAYLWDFEKNKTWFEWAIGIKNTPITRESIIGSFTHKIQQTSIDARKNTAKRNSLRVTRVLDRNLVFESSIFLNNDSETLESLLALAVQTTRQMGYMRNRGLGNVKCKLLANGSNTCQDVLHSIVKDSEMEVPNVG